MDARLLTRFRPFQGLDWEALATIARHARLLRLPAGRHLGRPGRPARGHYFLLKGAVRTADGITVAHGQELAREPLISDGDKTAQLLTLAPSLVLWADLAPVAFLLRPETLGYRVDGLEGLDVGDWLRRFLGDGVVGRLSPVALQQLLRAFEIRDAQPGEQVITAGEYGETFYVLARGAVQVKLRCGQALDLVAGDYFGEDALLTGRRRNASVRAVEHTRLMALHRRCFWRLLGDHVVRTVACADSHRERLDLSNTPAEGLRERCARTTADVPYLVCGGNRGLRALAVFLLARRGIDAVAFEVDSADGPR